MVAKAGGYYVTPFKGYHGVTEGYPLSPMIFNIVMDSVMRHWITVVTVEESGHDGFGRSVQMVAAFFLPQVRPPRLYTAGVDSGGVQCPDGALWPDQAA